MSATPSREYTAKILGTCEISGNTGPIKLPPRAQGLVGYLAAQKGRRESRDLLIDLLWEVHDPQRKRHSLNQLLYTIRTVAPRLVSGHGNHLQLSDNVELDLDCFMLAVTNADTASVLNHYQGRLLDGLAFITEEFESWSSRAAAYYEAQFIQACEAGVSAALEAHDIPRAASIARQATLIQPDCTPLVRLWLELIARSDLSRAVLELDLVRKRLQMEGAPIPPEFGDDLVEELARLSQRVEHNNDRTIPFVGRIDELGVILGAWRRTRSGAILLTITGEPGVGKSRLLEHSLRIAAVEGGRTFIHRCNESERHLPYSGLAHVLSDGVKRSEIEALDSRWAPGLRSVAPELLSGGPPEFGSSQREIWESVANLLSGIAARSRIVIAIDDAQWLDDSSAQLTEYLLTRLREMPVMVLLCGRTLPDDFARPLGSTPGIHVHLAELPPAAVQQLFTVFETSSGMTVPLEIRDRVIKSVGGRPFFILQALQFYSKAPRSAEVDPATYLVPPDVEKYLASRVAELPSSAIRVAAAAAVLGRTAPVHLLHRITGLNPTAVCSAVDTLSSNGILVDGLTTHFSHDLMREAVIQSLTEAEKALWHARIVDILSSESTASPAELAYHAERAGLPEPALRYARLAASQAERVHAYEEANTQYLRVVRCSDRSTRMHAQAEHIKFLAKRGRYGEVADHLEELKEYFSHIDDAEGLIICRIVEIYKLQLDGSCSPTQLLDRARDLLDAGRTQRPEQFSALLWQLTDCLRLAADHTMLDQFSELVMMLADTAELDGRSDLLANGCLLQFLASGFRKAKSTADEAVRCSGTLGDPSRQVLALFARGCINNWAGEPVASKADFEAALAKEDAFSLPNTQRMIRANLVVSLLELGCFDEAMKLAAAALETAPPVAVPPTLGNMVLISLALGDTKQAREHATAMLALQASISREWIRLNATALLGLISLQEGDLVGAAAASDFVHSQLGHGIEPAEHAAPYTLMARVNRAKQRHDEALAILSRASAELRERDYPAYCRLELERASTLASMGDRTGGVATAQEVRRHAEARGAVLLLREADAVLAAIG